jgi:hypothetical protein
MKDHSVSVRKKVLAKDLKYNDEILLTYKIEYPVFRSHRFRRCLYRVNRFYRLEALRFQRYCETELFTLAIEQYKGDIANNYPIRIFDAVQAYEVTDLDACIVSIYLDRYEYTGGAHGSTIRSSQTWSLQICGLFKLAQLVFCPPDYQTYILAEVEAQIMDESVLYFENYQKLIAQTFNKDSFYCTPEGIVVYYQQYDIGPYASGIREFLLPYGACVINPAALC